MREVRAETRETDLMMRQLIPVPKTLARAICNTARHPGLLALLITGVAFGAAASAQSTRTDLRAQSDGSHLLLSAHVADATGNTQIPSGGSVSFDTAQGSLGSALLDADGEATLTVVASQAFASASDSATLQVRAVYHPSAETPGSASAPQVLHSEATSGVPDFTVTAVPSTVTVAQGQYGSSLITVTPVNGFSEQVTLSCSGLPAQATCSFSPVIASTAAGAFTSTLEIQTQTASGALHPLDLLRPSRAALAWALPGALALAGLAAARRRAFRALSGATLLPLLLLITLALGGCSQRYGYLHHPPITTAGTPKGSYTLTLSASGNDGSAVTIHTLPIVLVVQ